MREFWKRIEMMLNERIGLAHKDVIALTLAGNHDQAKRSAIRAECMAEVAQQVARIYKVTSEDG